MKRSKLEAIFQDKDAFVEELTADPKFEGIEPEQAIEALDEIGAILDAVADENGILEEDELDEDFDEEALDAVEEASASDEDEFEDLHQSFIKQNLEAAEGKDVVIIEVGGPQATINVNPDGNAGDPEPMISPVAETENFAETSPVVIDGDEGEAFDEPFAEDELENAPLSASFSRSKASRLALNSSLQGKSGLRSLSSAVKKPVRAFKVRVNQSWVLSHKKSFLASALDFAAKKGRMPATDKDFAQVIFNAMKRESAPEGVLKAPFVSLKSAKTSAPFRALVLSHLRTAVRNFDESKFLKSGQEANFPKGGATKGKNAATLPDHLPELAGLPYMPNLLASGAKPRAIKSAEINEDGFSPDGTKGVEVGTDGIPVAKNMEKVGGDIPGRRRVGLKNPLGKGQEVGRGAIGDYGVQGVEVEHKHPQGASKVDPSSVTVDHVEIVPLKILEASVQYQLTPFVKINSNFSVADRNVVLVVSKANAARLGLPIHLSASLVPTNDRPDILGLIQRGQLAQSFSKSRERTIVKANKALMIKNSQFASVLIKAGLVGGAEGQKYETFRRLGDSYIASSGYSFPVAEGMRYGRPEYLVISTEQKQFFANQGTVKASVDFKEILSRVDTGVLESAQKRISSAEAENRVLRGKLQQLNQQFEAVRLQAARDLNKATSRAAQLDSELTVVKSSLTQAKLAARAEATAPQAPAQAPAPASGFALSSSTFQKLAGKPKADK